MYSFCFIGIDNWEKIRFDILTDGDLDEYGPPSDLIKIHRRWTHEKQRRSNSNKT